MPLKLYQDLVFHIGRLLRFVPSQQIVQLLVGGTGEREVESDRFHVAQFRGKRLLVPTGVESELVVRDEYTGGNMELKIMIVGVERDRGRDLVKGFRDAAYLEGECVRDRLFALAAPR